MRRPMIGLGTHDRFGGHAVYSKVDSDLSRPHTGGLLLRL